MNGIESIAAERNRQIEAEGWTTWHDDSHTDCSLAEAAACYANPMQVLVDGDGVRIEEVLDVALPIGWPDSWDPAWWKPKDRRTDLVRAGALIAAEIDRIDRAAAAQPKTST